VLTTNPLLTPRSRMSRAIPLLPLWALGGLLSGPGSSVGIATFYGLDGLGIESR
jgi:hypothetical protein